MLMKTIYEGINQLQKQDCKDLKAIIENGVWEIRRLDDIEEKERLYKVIDEIIFTLKERIDVLTNN